MMQHNREVSGENGNQNAERLTSFVTGELELEKLRYVIWLISNDFKIPVHLGQEGYGSYYDLLKREIVLDPRDIRNTGLFVAAHEAAHAVITAFPNGGDHIFDFTTPARKLLWNVTEDISVDTWLWRKYPGLRELIDNGYRVVEDAIARKLAEVSGQDLKRQGTPKIIQFLMGIYSFRLTGNFSEVSDQSVRDALEKVRESLSKIIDTIPNPQASSLERHDVELKTMERARITHDIIWPEFKKFLEHDTRELALAEMVKDILESGSNLQGGTCVQPGEVTTSCSQTGASPGINVDISNETRDEVREASNRFREEVLESLRKELSDQETEISRLKRLLEELESQKASSSQALEHSLGEEELREKNRGIERLATEIKRRLNELEELRDAIKEISNARGSTIQLDELTPKARRELMEAFSKLPQEYQEELRERAEERMSRLLTKLDEVTRPKLVEEPFQSLNERSNEPHTVGEQRTEELSSDRKENERIVVQSRPDAARVSPSVRIIKKPVDSSGVYARSEVDKFMDGLQGLAEDLRKKIKRILLPQDIGLDERGFPSGQILDVTRAMQAEVDRGQKSRLWGRPVAPLPGDYCFYLVIDLSGSMRERVQETIKGVFVTTLAIEPLERERSARYGIKLGILGFHNDVFPIKGIGENGMEVYSRLYDAQNRVRDGNADTNTLKATEYALDCIMRNPARSCNFILTFTDGEPNHDVRQGLKDLLRGIRNGKLSNEIRIETALIMLGENRDTSDEIIKAYCQEYGYNQGFALRTVDQGTSSGTNFPDSMAELIWRLLHKEHVTLMER
ncbi:MAG: hypothetical protein QXL01_04080 [Thermoplasmatales archaeon]